MGAVTVTSIGYEQHPAREAGAMLDRALPKEQVTITTTIGRDGRVTVGPVDPKDWEQVGESVMAIMKAVSSEKPIAHAGCLDPQRAEAMAQRLAEIFLRGGAS
jgi:hypothetical protein